MGEKIHKLIFHYKSTFLSLIGKYLFELNNK